MLYFDNQELAKRYHVSVRTVRNWIEAARTGKLDLTLHTKGQRTYIANTAKNTAQISELVERGKKYRPHRSQKTVTPQQSFYSLYDQQQLYDLVSNLEVNREVPMQYRYFGNGATNWDQYVRRVADEGVPNNLTATIDLLRTNQPYIDKLLDKYEQINVIDVGVGNAMPVRYFLEHLLDIGKLGRYIAIDISPTMLDIAESNIQEWFGGKVAYEGHMLDIEHDRFGNLLADEYLKPNAEKTTNLILFLGGTLQNFEKPGSVLKTLHDSMGIKDYFIHQQKLDTPNSRRYFYFSPSTNSIALAPMNRYLFDLLNIDESLYDVDMGYDAAIGERYMRVVLKIALSIRFRFDKGERIVNFNKGDSIQLWRARHYTVNDVVEQLTENQFSPLQISQTDSQEFVLTVSRIRQETH